MADQPVRRDPPNLPVVPSTEDGRAARRVVAAFWAALADDSGMSLVALLAPEIGLVGTVPDDELPGLIRIGAGLTREECRLMGTSNLARVTSDGAFLLLCAATDGRLYVPDGPVDAPVYAVVARAVAGRVRITLLFDYPSPPIVALMDVDVPPVAGARVH